MAQQGGGFDPFSPFGSKKAGIVPDGQQGPPPPGYKTWDDFWKDQHPLVPPDSGSAGGTPAFPTPAPPAGDTIQLWPFGPEFPREEVHRAVVGVILFGVLLIGLAEFIHPGFVGETKEAVTDQAQQAAQQAPKVAEVAA